MQQKLRHISSGWLSMHEKCRRDYTRKSRVEKAANSQQVLNRHELLITTNKKKIRDRDFDIGQCCLISGNEADLQKEMKKPQERRSIIHSLRPSTVKDKLLLIAENRMAANREDDIARQVHLGITDTMDLVAVKGRYHDECYKKFYICREG